MIIVKERDNIINIPKLSPKHVDNCNEYFLILKNDFTKAVFVFKVRDINSSPLYYCIKLSIPGCMSAGDYTYFLTRYDPLFEEAEFNNNCPEKTSIVSDKTFIMSKGRYRISKGRYIVSGRRKAILTYCGLPIVNKGRPRIVKTKTKDRRAEGYLETTLCVLQSGKLNYPKNCCKDATYRSENLIYGSV